MSSRFEIQSQVSERNIELPVPPEQLTQGIEFLEAAALEYSQGRDKTWTAENVINSFDLKPIARAEIIQGFFAKADGVISLKAMRRTLKMKPIKVLSERGKPLRDGFDPFDYHWTKYTEAKARKAAKTSKLVVVAKSA